MKTFAISLLAAGIVIGVATLSYMLGAGVVNVWACGPGGCVSF